MSTTVYDTLLLPDGTPAKGVVTFTLAVAAPDDEAIYTTAPAVASLCADGSFSVELVASDDPDWRTNGPVPYIVSAATNGLAGTFSAMIPEGGPWRLADLLPIIDMPDVVLVPGGPAGPAGPRGERGPEGPQGIPGPQGTGIRVKGAVPTAGDLPGGAETGDAWVVTSTGDVHIWSGSAWVALPHVEGPQGQPGIQGPIGPEGPSAVSADPGNAAVLGSDDLIFVPAELPPVEGKDGPEDVLALDGGLTPVWSPALRNLIEVLGEVRLAIGDTSSLHINGTLSEWLGELEYEIHSLASRPAVITDGEFVVDLFAGEYIRVRATSPTLEDGEPHWVTFELATVPGASGSLVTENQVASTGGTPLYERVTGRGPLVGETGGAVSNMALSNFIRSDRRCLVQADLSVPMRPTLKILELVDAGTEVGSILALDDLADVSAPLNTPAGRALVKSGAGWAPGEVVSLAALKAAAASSADFAAFKAAIAAL